MRRFIEEISVRDRDIANKIIEALETEEKENRFAPKYEVDMYENPYDPKRDEFGKAYPGECVCLLKIYVREDVKA